MACDRLCGHFLYVPLSAPTGHRSAHEQAARSACPHCGSHAITRKGVRKKKLEIVQLWRCASCKRIFTPGPAALRNKTYPIRLVLQALTLYNLGYSLNETAKRLKSKSGRAVSPSTIATWIGAHKEQTTFRRLRAEATTIYPPAQTIRSIKLYHRQVYAYAYHRSKLTLLRRNPQHRRFEALATFLENIPSTCPHDLFRRDDDPKARASQARPRSPISTASSSIAKRTRRPQTAALIIPAVGTNKLRHETLQNFMLANDSSTVAIEIPIWLTEDEISDTRNAIRHRARGGWGAALHHRPYRLSASPQRRRAHSRLQTGCAHQQADRAARDLCARAHHPRARPQALRHQVRLVQRRRIQRVLSAHAVREALKIMKAPSKRGLVHLSILPPA